MSKKRLYEIAKEVGKPSKEIVAYAQSLGLEVKSHSSSVEASDAKRIVANFSAPKKVEKAPQKTNDKNVVAKPAAERKEAPKAQKHSQRQLRKQNRKAVTLRLSVKQRHVSKSNVAKITAEQTTARLIEVSAVTIATKNHLKTATIVRKTDKIALQTTVKRIIVPINKLVVALTLRQELRRSRQSKMQSILV